MKRKPIVLCAADIKVANPMAKGLSDPKYRPRIVRDRKTYTRKGRKARDSSESGPFVLHRKTRVFLGFFCWCCLNNPSFFEGRVRSVFGDGFESAGRDSNVHYFVEFWYENTALFQVDLAAHLTGWIVLGCTNSVGVSSSDAGLSTCDVAYFRHSSGMVA